MWPHFINLLSQTWADLLRALGTTTLAVVLFSILVPVLIWFFTVVSKWWSKRRDQSPMTFGKALGESTVSAVVTASITLFVWLAIFGCFLVRAVYNDHQSLVSKLIQLKNEPKPTCPSCPTCPSPKPCKVSGTKNGSPVAASSDVEHEKRLRIRTALGAFLESNQTVKNSCLTNPIPTGFSCLNETTRWMKDAFDYISKNMEPSYGARFMQTHGSYFSYNAAMGDVQRNDALNTLTSKGETIAEFIKEMHD